MNAPLSPAQIMKVDRMWMLPPFKEALRRYARERTLLDQLFVCLERIFTEPQSPGLHLESLNNTESPVYSARINQGERLILHAFNSRELGLLNFGQHDQMYRWVDSHRNTLPTMLTKLAEVARGRPLSDVAATVRVVHATEDDPIALEAAEQFRRMLDGGISEYLAALDDDQRVLVNIRPHGLLVVKGGAGTGKTAVAMHRALARAQQPALDGPDKVLFLCYGRLLASAVQQALTALGGVAWSKHVEVQTFHSWCEQFLRAHMPRFPRLNTEDACSQQVFRSFGLLPADKRRILTDLKLDGRFVDDEINAVIKHRGFTERDEYLRAGRQGRRVALQQSAREVVWDVFEQSEQFIEQLGICRWSDLPLKALRLVQRMPEPPRYRDVIVDEGQDCSPVMMRLARLLAGGEKGNLSVFVDPAQCIFPNGFQWTQEELHLRGREVKWLRKNYRMTAEVFAFARPLLDGQGDLHDDLEHWPAPERHGPRPLLLVGANDAEVGECLADAVSKELLNRPPEQVAVLAPTHAALERIEELLRTRDIAARHIQYGGNELVLDEPVVKLLTMQGAKGLDFPAVFLIAPSARDLGGQQRVDLPEPVRTFHVALTRASERLMVALVDEQHHPVVAAVARGGYEVEGSRAAAFINRWGAV